MGIRKDLLQASNVCPVREENRWARTQMMCGDGRRGAREAIAPQAELEALIQGYSEQNSSLSLTSPPSDAAGASQEIYGSRAEPGVKWRLQVRT